MSIKLKEIELESFRAYKGRQLFNFVDERGEIANLVVIFAPNGFGKTSLLDAIEWGLNKEINRFENNEVLKKVTKLEKGIILNNRDSANSNGTVKFIDDEGKDLLLHTKVTGRIYRSDYNEGIEVNASSSRLKRVRDNALAKDNILSHDKIDSFLLSSSGHDRYEALAKFWDYSHDTTDYKTIYFLWNEVKKDLADKNKVLKRLVKDIKEISLPIDDVNLYIRKINELNIKNIHLPNMQDSISEKNLENLIRSVINQKSLVITQIRDIQDNIINIDQLYSSFQEYNEKSKLKLELKSKLKAIKTDINKFSLKKNLEKQKEQITKSIKEVEQSKIQLNTLKMKSEVFTKFNTTILNAEKKIVENNKHIVELKKLKHKKTLEILEIELNNQREKERNGEYFQEKQTLIQKVKRYEELDNNSKKIERRLIKLDCVINKRSDNINNKKNEIFELEVLLNTEVEQLNTYEFKNPIYTAMVSSLINKKKNMNSIQDIRNKKKKEYEQFGQFNDNLEKLIKTGKQIIEESESSECPLCSTPFSNFEILLEHVNSNINDVFKLDSINNEIKKLDVELETEKMDCEKIYNSLTKEFKKELYKIQQEVNIQSRKLQEASRKKERNNINKSHIDMQLESFINYFKTRNNNFSEKTFNESIEIIKSNLSRVIEYKDKLIESAEKKLDFLNKEVKDNKESILFYEKVSYENEILIENIKLNPDYKLLSNILKTFNIQFNNDEVTEKEKELNEKLNVSQEKFNEIELNIDNIKDELSGKELSALEKVLEETSWENEQHYKFTENYLSRYKNQVQVGEVREQIIVEKLKELTRLLETRKSLVGYFDVVNEKLEYTKKVLANSSKIKERNDITLELKQLNEIYKKLGLSLNKSQELIVKKINKAFNLEVINKIYSRIEPHPELKLMEIEPSFIGGKPSLEIYAPRGEERKDNPILFFSSAQLDILSLSIFLAKALMEPNPLLNTIFMDDPVHHMDSINVLSFIDLLRTLTSDLNRQIVLTTHNESLFKLIEQKIDSEYCNSKFIQLDSY